MIQPPISKGQRRIEQSPGGTRHELPGGLAEGSCAGSTDIQREVLGNTPRISSARKAPLSLRVQGFLLGERGCSHRMPMCSLFLSVKLSQQVSTCYVF